MEIREILKKSDTVTGLYRDIGRIPGFLRERKKGSNAVLNDYLLDHKVRKLQIGAGPNHIRGWLGTDISPDSDRVAYLDAARPFPIDDGAFDYVYSEHMIEHISWNNGQLMLRECYRILKPGGILRIATPDLAVLLSLYNEDRSAEAQKYLEWIIDCFLPDIKTYKAPFVINNAFRAWGHQFIYDAEVLTMALEQAGFTDIVQCAVGESAHADLKGIESHGAAVDNVEANAFETMVFEGSRHA